MAIRRVAVSVLAALPLFAQSSRPSAYTLEKESALGKQLAVELRDRSTTVSSLIVQNYIESLGQRLAAQLPKSNFPFVFEVISEDRCPIVHEPVALPGGYIFVPAALFLAVQDEAEFAGILAQALEQTVEPQGAQQVRASEISGSATGPHLFASSGCATEGSAPLGFLAQRRAVERQADVLAVQTMARARFDPNALVRYVERVQDAPTPDSAKSSPLPLPGERVADMGSVIAKLPTTSYPARADEPLTAAKEEVRRLLER